jgi:hypothetical protein
MTGLVYLIESLANGLYLFGALLLLLSARGLMTARYQLATAEFALERELALRRQARVVTRFLLGIEFILAVFAIANIVAPTMRTDQLNPDGIPVVAAADQGQFSTIPPANATIVNALGTPIDRAIFEAGLKTLTARPASSQVGVVATSIPPTKLPGTIIPGYPTPIGCENNKETYLEVPANGQVLYESLTVRGIAQTDNFSRYKFELLGPGTGGQFVPFGGDRTQPVKEVGVLGQLNLLPFEVGEYRFRLVVFDNRDTLKSSCTLTVILRRSPPTPTPITPTATPPPTRS